MCFEKLCLANSGGEEKSYTFAWMSNLLAHVRVNELNWTWDEMVWKNCDMKSSDIKQIGVKFVHVLVIC